MAVYIHVQSKKWATVFYGALLPSSLTPSFLVAIESNLGVCVIIVG